MKKIILSFDYEIYFDGGNKFKALIENTDKILEIASRNNAKLVFFIDVLYLIKLEESGQNNAFSELKAQVMNMLKKGHEIQFHYHPHWLNAKYRNENDRWDLDKTEYSYSDIIEKYGIEKANNFMIQAYNKFVDYFGVASNTYRSGGLSINKNQREVIDLLIENNFKYDSSVMPGLLLRGNYLNVDHTLSPDKGSWKFNSDSGFFKEDNVAGPFLTEIPVMTIHKNQINILNRLATSLIYRIRTILNNKNAGIESDTGKPFDLEIHEAIYPTSITFDKSLLQDVILLKHFTREFFKLKKQFMCILSHPKSYLDQSYNVFESYLIWSKSKNNNITFVGFNDLN